MKFATFHLFCHFNLHVILQTKGLASESDQGQMATPDFAEDSVTSQERKIEKDEKDPEKTKDPDKEKGKVKDTGRRGKEKHKIQALEGTNLHGLLQRLPCCVSRDQIDQLTVMTYAC